LVRPLDLGNFLPNAKGGGIMADSAPPQYRPTWKLNQHNAKVAEDAGFDFLLSMVKWRGFGGVTEHWDVSLESFTLMAACAVVTQRIQFYDLSTWTLPGARAKNGKAHVVHLADPAQTILSTIPRIAGQDLVFSTTGTTPPSGFSKAKLALDAAMANEARAETDNSTFAMGWRFHDFRRTAVTWLAGAGFPPHVADRLLNHVGGSIQGVAAIYQRGEFLAERKRL
jgi:hypothetical protein